MSRHYNPYALEPEPHPLRRSWGAVVERAKLAVAWLLMQLTHVLNRMLRLGSRPSAATIVEIQNAQRSLPKLEEITLELMAVRPRLADSGRSPNAFDRRPVEFEN